MCKWDLFSAALSEEMMQNSTQFKSFGHKNFHFAFHGEVGIHSFIVVFYSLSLSLYVFLLVFLPFSKLEPMSLHSLVLNKGGEHNSMCDDVCILYVRRWEPKT